MSIASGTQFGPYRIMEQVGAGGMGEIYRAVDTRLNRDVAIKVVSDKYLAEAFGTGSHTPTAGSGSPGTVSRRRFMREAQASSALNHPNVCTIYDIGEQDGRPFLVMELLRGQTLKQAVSGGPLSAEEVLSFSRQAAGALAAAHALGIIHRDIKPANIFVLGPVGQRRIKILDFGLAKHEHAHDLPESGETSGGTLATKDSQLTSAGSESGLTKEGAAVGTVAYMSPEQAEGHALDARTDLFSFGCVMYEMATGMQPFAGSSAAAIFAALLTKDSAPVSAVRGASNLPAMPPGFDAIVAKLLAKDKAQRYQSATELEHDLETMGIGSFVPSSPAAGHKGLSKPQMIAVLAGVIAAVVGVSVTLFVHHHHSAVAAKANAANSNASASAPKQSVILADFVNLTGDSVFEPTLNQALQIDLEQSPVIDVVSHQHLRQSVKYLGKPADTPITTEIAREIGVREGAKAVLTGTIASLGNQYVVTLAAQNAATGDEIASEQAQSADKEHVLDALGHIASKMRAKLGEDLASIRKLDTSFEDATTSSLEAFRAYALGHAAAEKGLAVPEAEGHYKRAIELDPNFAVAYAGLGSVYGSVNQTTKAEQYFTRAFALSKNISERERLHIAGLYYEQVTGEMPKVVETLQESLATYPNSHGSAINLGVAYQILAQYEKGLPYAEKGVQMAPENAIASIDLLTDLIALDRLDEARHEIERENSMKLNGNSQAEVEQMLAYFLMGEPQQVSRLAADIAGHPDSYVGPLNLMATQQFSGKNKQAAESALSVVELAGRAKAPDVQAGALMNRAIGDGLAGACDDNEAIVKQALALDKSKATLEPAAVAAAMCGNGKLGLPIAEDLAKKYPEDTLVHDVYVPLTRAYVDLAAGHAKKAVEDATPAVQYSEVYPGVYVQGLAYLQLHDAGNAISAFQTASRYRGSSLIGFSPFYAQAELGLGRAYAMQGDKADAKKAYDIFFSTWKNADANLPLLVEAKKEYAQL